MAYSDEHLMPGEFQKFDNAPRYGSLAGVINIEIFATMDHFSEHFSGRL
jgi:hypothetical protein